MGVELKGGVESRVQWKLACGADPAAPLLRSSVAQAEAGGFTRSPVKTATSPAPRLPWLTSWVISESYTCSLEGASGCGHQRGPSRFQILVHDKIVSDFFFFLIWVINRMEFGFFNLHIVHLVCFCIRCFSINYSHDDNSHRNSFR